MITTVIRMPDVPTWMVATIVAASKVLKAMEHFAKVRFCCRVRHIIQDWVSIAVASQKGPVGGAPYITLKWGEVHLIECIGLK